MHVGRLTSEASPSAQGLSVFLQLSQDSSGWPEKNSASAHPNADQSIIERSAQVSLQAGG